MIGKQEISRIARTVRQAEELELPPLHASLIIRHTVVSNETGQPERKGRSVLAIEVRIIDQAEVRAVIAEEDFQEEEEGVSGEAGADAEG